MGDDLRKVHAGDDLAIPAGAYNAFVNAARAEQSRQGDQGVPGQTLPRESGIILVKNTTESNLARFAVLGIDAPVFTPEDNEQEFKNRVALKGVTPVLDDHQLRFAVLLKPLAAGRIGLGMVQGVTPARLYVTNEGHRGAGMEEGKTGYLSSQASAYATTVLWKESGVSESEEDLKWAVVAFRGGGGGGGLDASVGLAEVVQIYNAAGNAWGSYAADGWQAFVGAHPIEYVWNEETKEWEWIPDEGVTLWLKLTDQTTTAEVGFKNVAGGNPIGYIRATDMADVPGRPLGTKLDGWVLLHAGDMGPWLSALQHATGGPGIDVDEVADPFKPKVKVDLAPDPGLEFVGEGDAAKLRALPDRNRGLDLDVAGIFIDLADANPGLVFEAAPSGDLRVLPNPEKGIIVEAKGVGVRRKDQGGLKFDEGELAVDLKENGSLALDAGHLYVTLASDTYAHGPDWLVGPGLTRGDNDGGLAVKAEPFGGITISASGVAVYAAENWGVTKNGETGELKIHLGVGYTGLELEDGILTQNNVDTQDPQGYHWHQAGGITDILADRFGRVWCAY